jgi:hypothetical protein
MKRDFEQIILKYSLIVQYFVTILSIKNILPAFYRVEMIIFVFVFAYENVAKKMKILAKFS